MNFSVQEISVLLKSIKFSSEKHQGQNRKGEALTPYINHPIEVAELLWNTGEVQDIPTIVGAILHDVLEDTETSFEEIEQLFGSEVASLVAEVSDEKHISRTEKKQKQLDKASSLSHKAKLIRIADKICNNRDILKNPPEDWTLKRKLEYFNWTENVMLHIRGAHPKLEKVFDQAIQEGRKQLGEKTGDKNENC